MGQFYSVTTDNAARTQALRDLLKALFDTGQIDGVLGLARQAFAKSRPVLMPTLISDATKLDALDPFAPVAPTNAAKSASSLSAKASGKKLAAILRSCELRALVELGKLNQADLDELLIIGIDCYGRFETRDFQRWNKDGDAFLANAPTLADGMVEGVSLTSACKSCEHPTCDTADIQLAVIGTDGLAAEALTERGEAILQAAGLKSIDAPTAREQALGDLIATRSQTRDAMFADMREKTGELSGLMDVVGDCINCYNCRVACPVCYCKECVFVTDTFRHEPADYVRWSDKRGALKMPTDTIFYHLTRMAHMSTLCVGCGQCSSACPNDIPVMELFRAVADKTQARFKYVPGQGRDEAQPLATFHDEELPEVTGQTK